MVNAYIANYESGTISVINTETNAVIITLILPADSNPVGVTISADGTKVYIGNVGASSSDGYNVFVIDTATNILSSINLETSTGFNSLAITPDGSTLYCSASNANQVMIIDISTQTVIATLGFEYEIAGVAASPVGNQVYLAYTALFEISVINTESHSVTGTISLSESIHPYGIAFNSSGNTAYVCGESASLYIINATDNEVSGTISLGDEYTFESLTVTPDDTKVYVACESDVVKAITLSDSSVVNITVGSSSPGTGTVSATPDSSEVYVTNSHDNTVSVISTATNEVTYTISVGNGPSSLGIFIQPAAVSPSNVSYASITNSGSGTSPGSVSITSLATGVTSTITVGIYPTGIVYGGIYIFVANYSDGTVSVISTATNTVIATLTVSTNPFGIAISPNGNNVYVANKGGNSISVISVASLSVIGTITDPSLNDPTGIAVTPDNAYIYVTNSGGGTVSIFNAATYALITTVTVGSAPYGIVISPDGTKAFVTNQGSNSVSVINTSTHAITPITTGVGSTPTGIALNPAGTVLYVTNYGSGTVSIFNASTFAHIATITVGTDPYGISITPDGTYIYVVNYGSNTISIISSFTNTVIATIPLASGSNPIGFGQFIQPASIPMTSLYVAPQGRLVPSAATSPTPAPVPTANVTAAGYVFYVPYQGNIVPIYNGANMLSYTFGPLLMTLNTTNQLATYMYDLFIFLNSGVVTIGAGPAWTNSTSLSSRVQQIDGIWVNSAVINLTNGSTTYSSIPVGQATYVGSVYMTANGETGISLNPAPAANGNANIIGLWNAYNRVRVKACSADATGSWPYVTGGWRAAHDSNSNRISWIDGLQQSSIFATYDSTGENSAALGYCNVGVGLNSTTAPTGFTGELTETTVFSAHAYLTSYPLLGFNYVQALETVGYGTETFFGGGELSILMLELDI